MLGMAQPAKGPQAAVRPHRPFAGDNEADVRQNRFLRFWPIKQGA